MPAAPSPRVRHVALAAAAGAAATAAWAGAEPLLARRLGHAYTDVRLLGRFAAGERLWRPAGIAIHLSNGAAFGAFLALTGPTTPRRAAGWTAVETLATWPLMAVADRIHPDRRSGRVPRLLTNRRVMVQEALMHALFAGVLAALFALIGRGPRR